jgi:glycosyltransferase involved in cell wall biosynthesis
MKKKFKYVLITPARNEEAYIEQLLQSVTSQTFLPEKWVIISDNSTDRTDEIVKRYEQAYPFIFLYRREKSSSRNFGSKVFAIADGYTLLKNYDYDFIGVTDADIGFPADCFEKLINFSSHNPSIGICGGVILERTKSGDWERMTSQVTWSVAGALQFFKRNCFDNLGGYLPLKRGGIDMIAEVMARMHNWKVQALPDLPIKHYHKMGTKKGGVMAANFKRGVMEYVNGYHPLFQFMRFFSWLNRKPFFLASLSRTAGYCWAGFKKLPYEIPDDVKVYFQKEQLQRLSSKLSFIK